MQRSSIVNLLAVCFVLSLSLSSGAQLAANGNLTYFGTYTDSASKGIYVARFDSKSGELSNPQPASQDTLKNPSFITIHPNKKYLYAVSEVENGFLSAYSINAETGQLNLLNQQSTGGNGPCFVSLDNTGTVALVANYNDGTVA